MLVLGNAAIWTVIVALLVSIGCYLRAAQGTGSIHDRMARFGRCAFVVAALCVMLEAVVLGVLLVTHRFDVKYVYEHSARAMAPLYWFPSFWAGQEGSFLLWAFWTAILGVVLARTSGPMERRVMPIYAMIQLFLGCMAAIKSPFLLLHPDGGPAPTEGLGLNPNLENPWMVIHPPTLFLGFASLNVPFVFAMAALLWKDWGSWLKRAMPWALFGFSVLGLAMMMGGYWAYEMLGWGGFWGWDPVENGPFIPWLALIAFLHMAQIQRVRGTVMGLTLFFALTPFVTALYETYLTRSGALDAFSVHSFSTLGGISNSVLLWVLAGAMCVSLALLFRHRRAIKNTENPLDAPASREFAFILAVILLTLCAIISTVGMSAPILTGLGQKIWPSMKQGSVPEDFYNRVNFPIALLLAVGLGIGPHLAWRGGGKADAHKLSICYAISVVGALGFVMLIKTFGTALPNILERTDHGNVFHGKDANILYMLLLFTACIFALISNLTLLARVFRLKKAAGAEDGAKTLARVGPRILTVGGFMSHVGVCVLLLGIVSLATFVRKDSPTLVLGVPKAVFGGAYRMTYRGQSGDYETDRNNVMKVDVDSADGRESYHAVIPYAARAMEDGQKMMFIHPAILHERSGDLYIAQTSTALSFPTPRFVKDLGMGKNWTYGPYTLTFKEFERDPAAAIFISQTGQMPDVFPVYAVLNVTYQGKTTEVRPANIRYKDQTREEDSPEVKLPGGWTVTFDGMSAGATDMSQPMDKKAATESAKIALREDSGPPVPAIEVDVSTRPMINLVWLGTLLTVAGGLLSMRRRIREIRVMPDTDDNPKPKAKDAPPQEPRRKAVAGA